MKNFFRNIPWVNILIVVLVSALLIGGIVGITAAVKEDMKDIPNSAFKRGALDSNGLFVDSDTSIYTKDLIECVGLEIEPDFEASGSYQVFYYDVNKSFIGATELIDASEDGVYMKGNTFGLAKYCRIMIIPECPVDDNGNTKENWKIRFYEVSNYADDYNISVSKNQSVNYEAINLLAGITIHDNMVNSTSDDYSSSHVESTTFSCTDKITVAGYKQLKLIVPDGGRMQVVFYDKEGTNLDVRNVYELDCTSTGEEGEGVIDILAGAEFIAVNIILDSVEIGDYHLCFVK